MIAIFPEIAASALSGNAEQLAILVRCYFGGAETYAPRPNITTLVEGAGISLRYLALSSEGALLAKDERGSFHIVMVLRQNLDQAAARFLMAHLLGHYLLDVQPLIARGDMQVSGYQEPLSPLARYCAGSSYTPAARGIESREENADAFAAALLLPRAMVQRAMEKLADVAKVASFFGVTRACLQRRLADLGMQPSGPANFLEAELMLGVPAAPVSEAQPLSAPDGSMPRAYAASSYGATEKATRQSAVAVAPAAATTGPLVSSPPEPSQMSPPSPLRGMDRIRELARKLDKGVPKTG